MTYAKAILAALRRNRPRGHTVTLGQFVRSWQESKYPDSTERVVVAIWGPIMVSFPRDAEGWDNPKGA